MQEDDLFANAARQLLRDKCSPQVVRAIEAGGSPQALWQSLEGAGFADALVTEDAGGAGLKLAQVFSVWMLCGAHAMPVPLAETMVARALLAHTGGDQPDGSITLAEGHLDDGGSLRCANVPMGRVASHVLAQHAHGWSLLSAAQADVQAGPFVLDTSMRWATSSCIAIALPEGMNVRLLQASLVAAQLAGALMSVFQRTLQHANERQQFGRPIGKFQAIQHQLAVMSEHVFAARMASQLGCAGNGIWPDRLRVAVAKARCSQAALAVAEAAHAIHGAVGFTQEHDLQLFTRRLHAWRQTAGSESYWHSVAGEALLAYAGPTLDALRQASDTEAAF
ncbi:MAG: acyl-CoA dehydrogenase family protein [Pseudomonadota bacterium]|nr:acyl-CoA dehydrogenase family protein [Pseudomonadota bacterium]